MPLRNRILLTLTLAMTLVSLTVVLFENIFVGAHIWHIVGIVLFIFGFVLLANQLFVQWITEPLAKFAAAAKAVREGKYRSEDMASILQRPDDVGELGTIFDQMAHSVARRDKRLELLKVIIPMGVRLSAEKDFDRLLEMMVIEAQKVTNADGGTLYLRDDNELRFVVMRNNSLNIHMGGRTGEKISFKPLNLYDENGEKNLANVAAYVVHKAERVHLDDAYHAQGFDFSGTKTFDKSTTYRSKSFLAFPLKGDEDEVIGVLQLINALDESDNIIPFASDEVIDSLALLTSAALAGYIRTDALRQEVDKLRIEIDQKKQNAQVEEITETLYFKKLQAKARKVRAEKQKRAK
jgi:nitrate/nitrite-specific signal transduction histidine kinase